jgi:hypothetical protein
MLAKACEIQRHEDRHREQKADQQFLRGAGIFRCVAVHRGVRPQMPPHVGRQPEAIEAERHQFEKGAAHHEAPEVAAHAVE